MIKDCRRLTSANQSDGCFMSRAHLSARRAGASTLRDIEASNILSRRFRPSAHRSLRAQALIIFSSQRRLQSSLAIQEAAYESIC